MREGLVQDLPDFQTDGVFRGGHPRFGVRPAPFSSPFVLLHATYARLRTLLVDELGKRREQFVCVWFKTVVFLPLALRQETH
jgi:hypothetical protein